MPPKPAEKTAAARKAAREAAEREAAGMGGSTDASVGAGGMGMGGSGTGGTGAGMSSSGGALAAAAQSAPTQSGVVGGGGGGYARYGQGGVPPQLTAEQRQVLIAIYNQTNHVSPDLINFSTFPGMFQFENGTSKSLYPTGYGAGGGGIFDSEAHLVALYKAYYPIYLNTWHPAPTAVVGGQTNGSGSSSYTVVEPDDDSPIPPPTRAAVLATGLDRNTASASTAIVLYNPANLPRGTAVPRVIDTPTIGAANTSAGSAAGSAASQPSTASTIDNNQALRAFFHALSTPFTVGWGVSRFTALSLLKYIDSLTAPLPNSTLLGRLRDGRIKRREDLGYSHALLEAIRADASETDVRKKILTDVGLINDALDALEAGEAMTTAAYELMRSYLNLMDSKSLAPSNKGANLTPSTGPEGMDMLPIVLQSLECDLIRRYMIFVYYARMKAVARARFTEGWASLVDEIQNAFEERVKTGDLTTWEKTKEVLLSILRSVSSRITSLWRGSRDKPSRPGALISQPSIYTVGPEKLDSLISRSEIYLVNGVINLILSATNDCNLVPGIKRNFREYLVPVEMDIPTIIVGAAPGGVTFTQYVKDTLETIGKRGSGVNRRGIGGGSMTMQNGTRGTGGNVIERAAIRAKEQLAEENKAKELAAAHAAGMLGPYGMTAGQKAAAVLGSGAGVVLGAPGLAVRGLGSALKYGSTAVKSAATAVGGFGNIFYNEAAAAASPTMYLLQKIKEGLLTVREAAMIAAQLGVNLGPLGPLETEQSRIQPFVPPPLPPHIAAAVGRVGGSVVSGTTSSSGRSGLMPAVNPLLGPQGSGGLGGALAGQKRRGDNLTPTIAASSIYTGEENGDAGEEEGTTVGEGKKVRENGPNGENGSQGGGYRRRTTRRAAKRHSRRIVHRKKKQTRVNRKRVTRRR